MPHADRAATDHLVVADESSGIVELLGRYSSYAQQAKRAKGTLALVRKRWPPRPMTVVEPPFRVGHRPGEAAMDGLVADYAAGMTSRQLAAKYCVARTSVLQLLKQRGVVRRCPRLTAAEQGEIVRLYQVGVSQVEIAKRFGRGAGTIWHALEPVELVGGQGWRRQ